MVINFICRASKADKSGQSPLEVSIIINGVRRYVHLDRKVKAADFNAKTQKVKRDASTNEYLVALRTKLYSLETEMLRNGMEVTIDTFIDAFKNGLNPSTSTLLKMFEFHNNEYATKRAQNVISYSTLLKYNVTKNYFAKYLKEKHNKADILVKDITPSLIDGFYLYLLESMCNNTAIQKMKELRKVLKMCVDEGVIPASPFKTTLKLDNRDVNPLSLEELRTIRNKEIKIERLERVRDMFVFECYTGLAFTDMHTLEKTDIITDANGKEWIIKRRQKTQIVSSIPLLPVAKEILVKYDWQLPRLCNQKFNGYLKEIGDLCGIEKSLHSHLARHTFATLLLNSGVDMVTVSKILGHANSRITERVYAKMLPETIFQKVEDVQEQIL